MSVTIPLAADCVSKTYGDRKVLSSASLWARPGMVSGLLGRNGAGKTTLLRILVGMMAPDNGVVRVDGVGQLSVTLAQLAGRGVFFLPARDLLLPSVSVRQQMRAARDRFGGTGDLDALSLMLGIADRVNQKPSTLSGGERRRAELAVALAREPSVLVADEPLRGITPLDADVLMGAMRAFTQRGGAVVITGHELPLLLPHLDCITWCHAGKTREYPSVEAAQQDFAFKRDFLPSMQPSQARRPA